VLFVERLRLVTLMVGREAPELTTSSPAPPGVLLRCALLRLVGQALVSSVGTTSGDGNGADPAATLAVSGQRRSRV